MLLALRGCEVTGLVHFAVVVEVAEGGPATGRTVAVTGVEAAGETEGRAESGAVAAASRALGGNVKAAGYSRASAETLAALAPFSEGILSSGCAVGSVVCHHVLALLWATGFSGEWLGGEWTRLART